MIRIWYGAEGEELSDQRSKTAARGDGVAECESGMGNLMYSTKYLLYVKVGV